MLLLYSVYLQALSAELWEMVESVAFGALMANCRTVLTNMLFYGASNSDPTVAACKWFEVLLILLFAPNVPVRVGSHAVHIFPS